MSVWRWETAPLSNKDKQIELLFHVLFNDKVPGIGAHFGKTFSLHRFLLAHKGEVQIHQRVLRKGKPLFTAAQMRSVLKEIGTQRGGASPTATSPTATSLPAEPVASGISAGTGTFDKIINKFAKTLTSLSGLSGPPGSPSSPCVETAGKCLGQFPSLPGVGLFVSFLSTCVFLLYHLETDIPILGPAVVSPALDAATLGLPATSEFLEAGLDAAGVIPGIGSVAVIASTFVGSILAFVATTMNLSRKQFGSAFQTSLGIVPAIGDALMETAGQTEIFLKRLQDRLDKVLIPVKDISPTAGAAAQQYIPSLDDYTGPSVPLTLETADTIKREALASLEKKAAQNPAISKALTFAKTAMDQLSNAVPPEILGKLKDNDLPGALQAAQSIVTLPPAQLAEKLGVPPEIRSLVEKGVKTASNAKNALTTLATAAVSDAMPLKSLTSSPPLAPSGQPNPNVKETAAATRRLRRSRRKMRRNTRRRR
jgi:hypothetical protein